MCTVSKQSVLLGVHTVRNRVELKKKVKIQIRAVGGSSPKSQKSHC